jgi:hypothetical protein
MMNALITALACVMVYRFGRDRFWFSPDTSALLSLGFGLSTIAWYYSEDFMSEPATTLFLLFGAYWITDPYEKNFSRASLLSGLFLGLAVTCRLATLVVVPGFLIYRFLVWRDSGGGRERVPGWRSC